MKPALDQIRTAVCTKKMRQQVENFYRVVCTDFPWLWAIRPYWSLARTHQLPKIRSSSNPGLKKHLLSSSSSGETWLVVTDNTLSFRIIKVARHDESWLYSIYGTLTSTYGSCRVEILYVVVVRKDGIWDAIDIYRSPKTGWVWATAEPLLGFEKIAIH